jgi:hypothetical protein
MLLIRGLEHCNIKKLKYENQVLFMKLDIEGAEKYALEGAVDTISLFK